ncbi:unnamed protein product [Cylicocyclus nassatus]|uniref:Uncharacterized protein n=1 Tax=Cylicocyclus nassatus TaxID=53992 RepID=A0AA36GHE9_CYLNA|nr:unnamed protein product [Cylicocyclus nassatus]
MSTYFILFVLLLVSRGGQMYGGFYRGSDGYVRGNGGFYVGSDGYAADHRSEHNSPGTILPRIDPRCMVY